MAAPPPAGSATARKVSSSAAPARRGAPAAPAKRAPLRVVRPQQVGRSAAGQAKRSNSRFLITLSIVMVVASLLVVVVGQAMLASGQVKMSTVQHELSLEQTANRQKELAVAQLEVPHRIVSAALRSGMVHPTVVELPYVSLTTPLPTPHVTPAPVAPTTSSSTTTPATK